MKRRELLTTMVASGLAVPAFAAQNRYLVISAVLPHFAPNPPTLHPPMHGWVNVLP